jgi:homoserine kinase
MKSVRVSVPASSGNLGSGFDVLAAALSLRNTLDVTVLGKGKGSFTIEGEGAGSLPKGAGNLVAGILAKHLPGKTLSVRMRNAIPLGRGLGSSGAARLAAHAAGLALKGKDPEGALALAAADEGHPDNVAASARGGLTAVLGTDPLDVYRLAMPKELKAVVCVPAFELSTEVAREALPSEIPLMDAVFNLSRALAWPAAILEKRYDRLRAATEDALHQPYRRSLVPGLREVIAVALEAGALGACLSGAGPTVLAVCRAKSDLQSVGRAMSGAFRLKGVKAVSEVLDFDNRGLRVE